MNENLKSILEQEESWAYENQMDAVKNNQSLEIAWNRGYRCALKDIAEKTKTEFYEK